jgi:hypothetical protein
VDEEKIRQAQERVVTVLLIPDAIKFESRARQHDVSSAPIREEMLTMHRTAILFFSSARVRLGGAHAAANVCNQYARTSAA